jgi:predicted AlkP superfamily phosphohydrolase/phosphomutase
MGRRNRVLWLSAEAMDPKLIRAWAAEGRLPAFRRLLESASISQVQNPRGVYVGATWPTIATGVSPAVHGSYCFDQFDPITYRDVPFSPDRLAAEPFWMRLSRIGRRVAVFDVPLVPLTRPAGGAHIVGWGSHDPIFGRPKFWPSELECEVNRAVGRAPLRACDGLRRSARSFRALRSQLLRRVQLRVQLASRLFDRGPWDLFAAVFSESHCAGHQMWHLHDPSHPRHDPGVAADLGNPLLDVYQAIDDGIGRLLQCVDLRETLVLVLASHGMGPHYDATFLLDAILTRIEDPCASTASIGPSPIRNGWMRLHHGIRGAVSPWLRPTFRRFRGRRLAELRRRRRFFAIPNNDAHGGIRINLIGRESAGLVRPGREYEELCDELRRRILELRNVETDEPVATDVHRTGAFFAGRRVDALPDLLVEWNRRSPIRRVVSPVGGLIEGVFPGTRTGDHTPGGVLFAFGSGLEAGKRLEPIEGVDVAATIAHLLGGPPDGLEGRPFLCVRAGSAGAAAR